MSLIKIPRAKKMPFPATGEADAPRLRVGPPYCTGGDKWWVLIYNTLGRTYAAASGRTRAAASHRADVIVHALQQFRDSKPSKPTTT